VTSLFPSNAKQCVSPTAPLGIVTLKGVGHAIQQLLLLARMHPTYVWPRRGGTPARVGTRRLSVPVAPPTLPRQCSWWPIDGPFRDTPTNAGGNTGSWACATAPPGAPRAARRAAAAPRPRPRRRPDTTKQKSRGVPLDGKSVHQRTRPSTSCGRGATNRAVSPPGPHRCAQRHHPAGPAAGHTELPNK